MNGLAVWFRERVLVFLPRLFYCAGMSASAVERFPDHLEPVEVFYELLTLCEQEARKLVGSSWEFGSIPAFEFPKSIEAALIERSDLTDTDETFLDELKECIDYRFEGSINKGSQTYEIGMTVSTPMRQMALSEEHVEAIYKSLVRRHSRAVALAEARELGHEDDFESFLDEFDEHEPRSPEFMRRMIVAVCTAEDFALRVWADTAYVIDGGAMSISLQETHGYLVGGETVVIGDFDSEGHSFPRLHVHGEGIDDSPDEYVLGYPVAQIGISGVQAVTFEGAETTTKDPTRVEETIYFDDAFETILEGELPDTECLMTATYPEHARRIFALLQRYKRPFEYLFE